MVRSPAPVVLFPHGAWRGRQRMTRTRRAGGVSRSRVGAPAPGAKPPRSWHLIHGAWATPARWSTSGPELAPRVLHHRRKDDYFRPYVDKAGYYRLMAPRVLSLNARHAADLLGASIKAGRLDRGWTIDALAERAQVGRDTVMKVERGDPSVSMGTVFDCAVLVGVPLFYDDERRLAAEAQRSRAALIGRRARSSRGEPEPDLDF